MIFTYPAVFHKNPDNTYSGYFPDLEGCTASGSTVDEVLNDAIEAARTWIYVEFEMDEGFPMLPPVTYLEDIKLEGDDFARNISVIVRLRDGWDE